jgi:peroxiredoxin
VSFAVLVAGARADTPAINLGKKVADFTLKDTQGNAISLDGFKDKKAVVVVFIGTECPINNAYMPRLAELDLAYRPRGVQFIAINSNCQDTLERVADHARRFAIPFAVLKDEGNVVADLFGARRTPEAFLLDGERKIRYQGRIDDQFGVGYKRAKPTRRDLAEAMDELLAGRPVSQPTTRIAGCLVSRLPREKAAGIITFTRHIAPILQKHCQECHRPGQIGPMPLLTYEDAAAWSATIHEVVQERRMPPWFADPRYGHFANDRRLSAQERETLLAWIDQGTPRGDDKDLPPSRHFVSDWTIGQPDLVLTMGQPFEVPGTMPRLGIPYKHFYVDTGFKEDHWVVRAEARPGAPEVVHHVILFVEPPGEKFFPGNPKTPALAGTAPGDMPLVLPPGAAKKIPAGARLVFQMHYTPNGKPTRDLSSVGLIFAKDKPERQVLTEPIANPVFKIPAGAANYKVEAWFPFHEAGHILAFMPHMHLRGKDFRFEAVYPDGRRETLLSVPHYNFNWQSVYRFAKPVAMPRGSKIHCIAHFDNSAKNPNNPDPTKTVVWGDQTWEEMMIGWMDYLYDRPAN